MKKIKILSFRNRKILFLSLIAFGIFIIFVNFKTIEDIDAIPPYKSKCDLEATKRIIENVCDLYHSQGEQLVLGSLCKSLCNSQNKFEFLNEYKLVDCYNPKPIKPDDKIVELYDAYKAVLIYELIDQENNVSDKPKRIVLKSRHKYFLDFDSHLDFDFSEYSVVQQLKYLYDYFEITLDSKFGIRISNHAKTWLDDFVQDPNPNKITMEKIIYKKDFLYYVKLFAHDYKDFVNAIKTENRALMYRFVNNLIILMSQDEYLFYRFFQLKPGILKIYGTCGHFYSTEYAQSLAYKVRRMDLEERKALALKFLDLVHSLDTVYLIDEIKKNTNKQDGLVDILDSGEGVKDKKNKIKAIPMHVCDVKLDNFGLNSNNDIVLIDTDMIHPDAYLFNKKICEKHEDCHYFDCKSFCDPIDNRCIDKRVNNNLQTLCEKIFDNDILKSDGIISGGKFERNVRSELMRRLEQCKLPGFYHGSNIPVATNDTLIRVFNVLLKDRGVN